MRSPAARSVLAFLGAVFAIVLLSAAAGGLWFRSRVSASLPILDGRVSLSGLGAEVRIARDSLGVPTVDAADRLDVARATGWLHAQDRFFQMDLLRRRGAGELSELFGPSTLPLDRQARMHGFRSVAREAMRRATPAERSLFEAYTSGVNSGLAALGATPWEYAVLRSKPRAWAPEDSLLVSFAMALTLQDSTGREVRTLAVIRDQLGPKSLAFFAPVSTPDDAALDGTVGTRAPVPPPSEIDLRSPEAALRQRSSRLAAAFDPAWPEREEPGSNSMAVSGRLAKEGGALVANDMHLRLEVPNTWYRMALRWPGHAETGLTLPGAPALVAGSTGRIAWGFTNSKAGTGDIVMVDPSVSPYLYHGPHEGKLAPFEMRSETVVVRGAKPVTMTFPWTAWGPIVADGPKDRLYAFHWTEDDPAASNAALLELEDAPDVRSAIEVAHRMGIPAQNFVVADSGGSIGWTIAGFLPRRFGYDGRLPVSWAFGDRGWAGYLASTDVPSVISAAGGRLWTANNRTTGGASLRALGDAGYAAPARARQIRDDLDGLIRSGKPVGPADLLGVELDDRAVLLEKWRAILAAALTPAVASQKSSRAALLEALGSWDGRASVGSAGYRVVRAFRLAVAHRALDPIFAPCAARLSGFSWSSLNYEAPLEALLRERPIHLLAPPFSSWDELLVAAADDVSDSYLRDHLDPRSATWGRRNTARIEHPFARNLPRWASSWMSMPAEPLPGDSDMPRVQDPSFGASERFAVSPGRESEGILHMPGGQSANPLSPYFAAGHEAWVRGTPTPFLPGPTEHTITLEP